MEKSELQMYINKLKLMHDYAESEGDLLGLNNLEIKALEVAVKILQEKCDSSI